MKKENFIEFLKNAKIEKDKWTTLPEVESIVLSSGRGIYPNWKHLRFKVYDDIIFVQHGDSEPYGARLGNMFSLSGDKTKISFPPSSILAEVNYPFRQPVVGDILRVTNGKNNLTSEAMIVNVLKASNCTVYTLSNPINATNDFRLSFYDPTQYEEHSCMHSSEIEGFYMKFTANQGKERKTGIFHELIKVKDISEIKIKLGIKNKTYTVKDGKHDKYST